MGCHVIFWYMFIYIVKGTSYQHLSFLYGENLQIVFLLPFGGGVTKRR